MSTQVHTLIRFDARAAIPQTMLFTIWYMTPLIIEQVWISDKCMYCMLSVSFRCLHAHQHFRLHLLFSCLRCTHFNLTTHVFKPFTCVEIEKFILGSFDLFDRQITLAALPCFWTNTHHIFVVISQLCHIPTSECYVIRISTITTLHWSI